MKLVSIQMAMFANNLIPRPDLLMNKINTKMNNVFDAIPNIINLTMNAPPEIPVAQVTSTNNVYALNISRSRVDLTISPFYYRQETPLQLFEEYKSNIESYYNTILEEITLNRVGMVVTLFHEEDSNIKAIFDKYLIEPYTNDCVEINYRINRQTLEKGVVYNNIRLIQAGEIQIDKKIAKGVMIQFDVNNVPDQKRVVSKDSILEILSKVQEVVKTGYLKELI